MHCSDYFCTIHITYFCVLFCFFASTNVRRSAVCLYLQKFVIWMFVSQGYMKQREFYNYNKVKSQGLVWPSLFFYTAWTAWRQFIFFVLSFGSLQIKSSRFLKGHFKFFFGCWLPFVSFSFKMILRCLKNVEIQASVRPSCVDLVYLFIYFY